MVSNGTGPSIFVAHAILEIPNLRKSEGMMVALYRNVPRISLASSVSSALPRSLKKNIPTLLNVKAVNDLRLLSSFPGHKAVSRSFVKWLFTIATHLVVRTTTIQRRTFYLAMHQKNHLMTRSAILEEDLCVLVLYKALNLSISFETLYPIQELTANHSF